MLSEFLKTSVRDSSIRDVVLSGLYGWAGPSSVIQHRRNWATGYDPSVSNVAGAKWNWPRELEFTSRSLVPWSGVSKMSASIAFSNSQTV